LALAVGGLGLTTRLNGTLASDTDEARITATTARLLEESSYSGHQETEAVSSKFLDSYLDMLDPNRVYFLQADIEEFAPYRADLEALAVRKGDTSPAHRIFNRFLERLGQRVAYNKELLSTDTFDFTGGDSYRWDRHDAPRPRDAVEARQ